MRRRLLQSQIGRMPRPLVPVRWLHFFPPRLDRRGHIEVRNAFNVSPWVISHTNNRFLSSEPAEARPTRRRFVPAIFFGDLEFA
jgi:hypothetical protein